MSLRLVNNVAGAIKRIPPAVMSRAIKPRNITQCRAMSKKNDCPPNKNNSAADNQFFAGCFKKTPREPCPEQKQKPSGTCKNPCKGGPCKPGK